MSEHTPTPWNWIVHDYSMASLGAGDSPGLGDPLVLCVAPCDACAKRAEPREWQWGRCHTPSEADADFIVKAVNSHDALVKALEEISDPLKLTAAGVGVDRALNLIRRMSEIAKDALSNVGELRK